MEKITLLILLGLTLFALITAVELLLSRDVGICRTCRYIAKRDKHGIKSDTCKIWGYPCSGVKQCKNYEHSV